MAVVRVEKWRYDATRGPEAQKKGGTVLTVIASALCCQSTPTYLGHDGSKRQRLSRENGQDLVCVAKVATGASRRAAAATAAAAGFTHVAAAGFAAAAAAGFTHVAAAGFAAGFAHAAAACFAVLVLRLAQSTDHSAERVAVVPIGNDRNGGSASERRLP